MERMENVVRSLIPSLWVSLTLSCQHVNVHYRGPEFGHVDSLVQASFYYFFKVISVNFHCDVLNGYQRKAMMGNTKSRLQTVTTICWQTLASGNAWMTHHDQAQSIVPIVYNYYKRSNFCRTLPFDQEIDH